MFTSKKRRQIIFAAGLIVVLPFVSLHGAEAASTYKKVKGGNEMFDQGQYDDAVEEYRKALEKEPESDIIQYDLGTALYKVEEYDGSIGHLEKVLLSEEELLKQKAYHNLGNAHYKRGILEEEYDLDYTVEQLEKSLKYFEDALKIEVEEDSQFNYEFVKKEIERLKLQQQEQKQGGGQQDSKEDQESAGDKKEGENQGDKDQEQQGSQSEKQDQDGSGDEDQSSEGEQQSDKDKKDGKSGEGKENQKARDQEQSKGDRKQDGSGKDQKPQSGQSSDTKEGELTQLEAQMLLDNYQQSEEPKGLLKIQTGVANTQPVLKDW